MLLLVLALIFFVVALTRPGPNRLFSGRDRHARSDAGADLRDPTRGR